MAQGHPENKPGSGPRQHGSGGCAGLSLLVITAAWLCTHRDSRRNNENAGKQGLGCRRNQGSVPESVYFPPVFGPLGFL